LIEGVSNAVLEKLTAGLSVVAIDVIGNPEALDSMLDCELVGSMTSADLVREIQAAIERSEIASLEQRERRRLVCERFSVGALGDVYEHLYLSRVIDEAC